tara:strand:- start:6992 stop:9919 length:2928 start_codon:yes stop_codon:yes gene_type:complete
MKNFGRKALAHLRRENGDTDPVLTIVGMIVTAAVTATIIGVMITVVQLGGNYIKEQGTALSLSTAQKSWSTDANNASLVVVEDEHRAVFYEMPDRHPGVYIPRNEQTDTYCRESVWTLDNGTLTNVVSFYENPTCATVDTDELPTGTTTLLSISGLSADTAIVAKNTAGRDLHFADSSEIGLSASAATPSVNDRNAWWRDYEWESTLPREINIEGTIDMPLSGDADSTLTGSTWNSEVNAGDTATTPEIVPDVTTYNPGPITGVTVERSATVGEIHGGVREGISIGFNQVLCGPYSTSYVVTWTPTTPGAEVRSASPPASFGSPPPVNLAGVPNGATGNVTIVASCPPEVSTEVSTSDNNPYTQPIPGTVLTAEIGALPHQHNLSWTSVSSLPVEYLSEVSFGGDFVPQNRATPNPTTDLVHNLVFPEGSTYGVTHVYRVTGSLSGVEGKPSNEVALTTPWPAVETPTLTGSSTGTSRTVTISNVACPAGTYGEYRLRFQSNESGWQSWSPWSATVTSLTFTLIEGEKAEFEGQARCAYSPTQVSPPSDTATTDPWVQPITSTPNPPVITVVDEPDENDPVTIRYVTTTCPVETYPEYRVRYSINEDTLGPWSTWSTTTSTTASMWTGEKLNVEVQARCISDWTPEQPGTEGPPVTTVNPPWIRPIPAPDAPLNVRHDNGGTSTAKADRVLWNAVVCPTNTTPSYNPRRIDTGNYAGWREGLTHNVSTSYGTRYTYAVVARCVSVYTNSPNSAQSNQTGWTTPIPTPSTPTISVPSSQYAGYSFTVSAGGSTCASPSDTYYDFTNSRDGATPSDRLVSDRGNANATDYWSYTGYVTYSVRIQCRTADTVSSWSSWVSDGINIVNPPAPSAPTGVSADGQWTRLCGNIGFSGTGTWNSVSGATSYNTQVAWTTAEGASSGWTSAGSTSSTKINVSKVTSFSPGGGVQFRVQAVGVGGASGWSTAGDMQFGGGCQTV